MSLHYIFIIQLIIMNRLTRPRGATNPIFFSVTTLSRFRSKIVNIPRSKIIINLERNSNILKKFTRDFFPKNLKIQYGNFQIVEWSLNICGINKIYSVFIQAWCWYTYIWTEID